jgi:hypothetical protein
MGIATSSWNDWLGSNAELSIMTARVEALGHPIVVGTLYYKMI